MKKIFVFGSNLAGRHGAGAALFAKENHGAIYGRGEGLQGQSYGIPTKDGRSRNIPLTDSRQTLSLPAIEAAVLRFIDFARGRPELHFEVTPIGCGRAGFTPAQIAPFFRLAPSNCDLSEEFLLVLTPTDSSGIDHQATAVAKQPRLQGF